MHLASLAFLVASFSAFWDYVHAHLPIAVVAIAIAIQPSLQLLKKYVPLLNGWVAMLANFVLACLGVWAVTPADQFWTIDAWMRVLQASGIAAGIHGTIGAAIRNGLSATSNSTPSGNAAQNNKLGVTAPAIALLGVLLLGSTIGCAKPATNTAQAPQSIYQRGAAAMDDFATDLQSAQNIEINLHKGGAIDDATHKAIQSKFSAIAGYGQQIDALIKAQASATTITDRVNSAIASLTAISTTAADLDPSTLAQVNQYVGALTDLLTKLLPIFAPTVSMWAHNPHPLEVAYGPTHRGSTGRAIGHVRFADLQPSEGRSGAGQWHGNDHTDRNAYLRC